MEDFTGLDTRPQKPKPLFSTWEDVIGILRNQGRPKIAGPTSFPAVTDPTAAPPTADPTTTPPAGAPMAAPSEPTPAATPDTAPSWGERMSTGISNFGKGLQDPGKMALLTAGLKIMATPPRQVPYSNMEVIGQGGLAGVEAYQNALKTSREAKMAEAKMAETSLAHEDLAQYRRDQAETSRLNQQSLTASRIAAEEAKKTLDAPIDKSTADYFDISPDTTVRRFQAMQGGLVAKAKPDKEPLPGAKRDYLEGGKHITEFWDSEKKAWGGRKEAPRYKPVGEGGGIAKPATINQINAELTSHYFPIAKKYLESQGEAGVAKAKEMTLLYSTIDTFGGSPGHARTREQLPPDRQAEYDWVGEKAQEYSSRMNPKAAVRKAREEWKAQKKTAAPTSNAGYEEFRSAYEQIRNYAGWDNAEKNKRIAELNRRAKERGLIP